MPDRDKSIPLNWHRLVIAETYAAAHQLRAIGLRLESLALTRPLPPEDVRTAVFESGDEETLDSHPTLALHADLSVLASSEAFDLAMSLEQAPEKYAPPEISV